MTQCETRSGCPPSHKSADGSASPTLDFYTEMKRTHDTLDRDVSEFSPPATPQTSTTRSSSSATVNESVLSAALSKHASQAASSNGTPTAVPNKWASVLDQDVMAAALRAVRAHREAKLSETAEAHPYSAWAEVDSTSHSVPEAATIRRTISSGDDPIRARCAVRKALVLPAELPAACSPMRSKSAETRVFAVHSPMHSPCHSPLAAVKRMIR